MDKDTFFFPIDMNMLKAHLLLKGYTPTYRTIGAIIGLKQAAATSRCKQGTFSRVQMAKLINELELKPEETVKIFFPETLKNPPPTLKR